MVRVTLWCDEGGQTVGFSVYGHAGYRPRGRDIVCAAVSALTQAAVLGLEEYLSVAPEVHKGEGSLRCLIPEDLPLPEREKAEVIFGTMELGLRAIAMSYSRFVQVETRRWSRCAR
ncbi:MAG TPA: ribosomal-processing cysteine protease Prp [Peptococcaceae bacterium]|nr:ribosomal-processing cysteine protease Prp [Peptococcaceae bacterium]